MLVTAWWFLCPDPFRVEGLRLGVPASVSSLSGVCNPEVMGSITLDRPGLRLPSGGPAPFPE